MKKIDLDFRDPELEAEELLANRVVAHNLKKQNDEWTKAKQQRDVQRLWMLWCEGVGACANDPSKFQVTRKKARSGSGQVRLKTQRRRSTAPTAHEGAKLLHRHVHQVVGLGRFRGVRFTCGTKFDCRVPSCCKETLEHCRLPSLEQVCGLAADLSAEVCTSLARGQLWSQFEAEFGEHIPCACESIVNELTGEKLNNACKRMRSTSALGVDGWRWLNYKHSRCSCLRNLNLVEESGTWPVPLTQRLISLIPKGEVSAPQKLRPMGPHGFCVQAVGIAESK